jgi:chitodextrinase
MKATIYFSIASLIFAFGCEKKPHEEPTSEPSAAITAPTAATAEPAASAPLVVEDSDIEVPEDFAEEAAEEITPQNLDSELAALEKEINNDS